MMKVDGIKTMPNSSGSCIMCKEPLIKGEGVMYAGGLCLCYKCSLKNIEGRKKIVNDMRDDLHECNIIDLEELNQRKLAKEL